MTLRIDNLCIITLVHQSHHHHRGDLVEQDFFSRVFEYKMMSWRWRPLILSALKNLYNSFLCTNKMITNTLLNYSIINQLVMLVQQVPPMCHIIYICCRWFTDYIFMFSMKHHGYVMMEPGPLGWFQSLNYWGSYPITGPVGVYGKLVLASQIQHMIGSCDWWFTQWQRAGACCVGSAFIEPRLKFAKMWLDKTRNIQQWKHLLLDIWKLTSHVNTEEKFSNIHHYSSI